MAVAADSHCYFLISEHHRPAVSPTDFRSIALLKSQELRLFFCCYRIIAQTNEKCNIRKKK